MDLSFYSAFFFDKERKILSTYYINNMHFSHFCEKENIKNNYHTPTHAHVQNGYKQFLLLFTFVFVGNQILQKLR